MNSSIIAASRLRQQAINPFADAQLVLDLNDRGFGNVDVATIRRSTDNIQQNFTSTEMADGTAQAFTGANNGFVQLLDHTGNGFNGAQTVLSEQPKAIDTGSLILNGGKLVSLFNGIGNELNIAYTANTVITVAMKLRVLSVINFGVLINSNKTNDLLVFRDGGTNNFRIGNGSTNNTVASSIGATPIDIKLFYFRGASSQLWMNDNTLGNFAGIIPSFSEIILSQNSNIYLESFMLWNSDKRTDRIKIQNAL